MASLKNRLPSFLLPPSTTTTLFSVFFLLHCLCYWTSFAPLLSLIPCISVLLGQSVTPTGSVRLPLAVDKMPWLKKVKEKGLFGLKIQGYKLSLLGHHGIRSLRWRVTVHLQSGSRERWMSMLSLLSYALVNSSPGGTTSYIQSGLSHFD